jgi:hypothetical protein
MKKIVFMPLIDHVKRVPYIKRIIVIKCTYSYYNMLWVLDHYFYFQDWRFIVGQMRETEYVFVTRKCFYRVKSVQKILLEKKARDAATINHVSRIRVQCYLSNKSTNFRDSFSFMITRVHLVSSLVQLLIELYSTKNN